MAGNHVREIYRTGEVKTKLRGAVRKALKKVAKELNTEYKEKLGVYGGGIPSAPGEVPRRQRTSRKALVHNTKVFYEGNAIKVKTTKVGKYLDEGTRRMLPRPFIHRILRDNQRKWAVRIGQLTKRFMTE